MTETPVSPTAAASPGQEKAVAKTEAKKKASAPKIAKSAHPSAAEMVYAAVEALADRGGSSLQAIKKYITLTYKVDVEKQALFIRKYLKSAVAAGTLIQTKGKGANGSFKLPVKSDSSKSKPKVASVDKAVAPKKTTSPKKPATKKPASPKKAVEKKVSAAEKKTVAKIAKPKSSPKAKKVVKSPTVKPKSPKPKKTAAPKATKAAAKKAVAQKQ